jgi:hypothetical protein
MRRFLICAAALVPLTLAACGGGGDDNSMAAVKSGPVSAPLNVQPCLDQVVVPGKTVANLVVPDTIKDDLTQASGFPNGRRLTDPVIDITLAFLFIDLTRHPVDVLARLPINPSANDQPFRTSFPYLAPPNGNPPGLTPGPAGASYNFRTDAPSAYVQVDRMGMPAIATAVISSSHKNEYNDDSPSVDGARKYVTEISSTLTGLANALADDWQAKGLTVCAKPTT